MVDGLAKKKPRKLDIIQLVINIVLRLEMYNIFFKTILIVMTDGVWVGPLSTYLLQKNYPNPLLLKIPKNAPSW